MAEEEKKEEKKIIVDEDWKKEARKEKEILAAQEKPEKKEEEQGKRTGPLPKGNFAALISMLTTQALFSLGLLQIKGQEQKKPDLELAKYNIDMLETIEEKTKGNLSEEEKKVLENTLNEIRMAYVKISG
jgi:cytochrome c-type biogenesis protein CcmH/NrfG